MRYTLADLPRTRNRDFRVIMPTATQEGELLRLYMPILKRWRTAAVAMLELYARGQDTEQENNHTAMEIAALLLLLRFRSFFEKVEAWHRAKWLSSVSFATGVDAKWMTAIPVPVGDVGVSGGTRQTGAMYRVASTSPNTFSNSPLSAFSEPSGRSVTSQKLSVPTIDETISNATTSARTFAKSLSDDAQNRINQALNAGHRTGAKAEDVAREINAGLSKTRKRAINGAENEVDNAVKMMTDARMAEAGIDMATWRHFTPRERARPVHLARQGSRYAVSDPVWSELFLPFCRCQKRPVLGLRKSGSP